jgi:hypothetical protein
MKRPKKGEWTDVTVRAEGDTDTRPLKVVFRGTNGLYFVLWRKEPLQRWILRCDMFDLLAVELEHVELAPAQSQATNHIRRELVRITEDLQLAQRKIA